MTDLPPFLYFIGFIVLAIAVVYTQYRMGAKKINSEVISNYEILDRQQKEQLREKDKKITQYQLDMAEIKGAMAKMKEDFANQIGILQGQLTAKQKQVDDLQATVLNRNPNLENILIEIRDFMQQLSSANKHQTTILEASAEREKKIDSKN